MSGGRLILLLLAPASGYSPKGSPTTFATFNNAHTKELIKAWKPRPLPSAAPQGDGLMPSSKDNMRRFVRARILLEDRVRHESDLTGRNLFQRSISTGTGNHFRLIMGANHET